MKKITILLTTLFSLGLMVSVYAQQPNIQPSLNKSLAGAYVGFGAGAGMLGIDNTKAPFVGIRIYGGYLWQQSPNLLYGIEGGYNEVSILDVQGILKYHYDNGFNVFAKTGVARVNLDNTIAGAEEKTFCPEATIGLGYDFNSHFSTNISYSHYFQGSDSYSTDAVLLNVEYHFA